MNIGRLHWTAAVLLGAALFAAPALAVDWASVPGKDVTLLYPAQMNWELLLTQGEHSGAGKFREGKNCRQCHDGEEASSGKLMVSDKSLEPTPIPGKPGSVKATLKFAHDAERMYVRIEWDPGKQPDAGMEPKFDSKVALMIDDRVNEVSRDGCFAACHSDLQAMPNGGNGTQTMYLVGSRTSMSRNGGGPLKSADELAKMRADGLYLEYWQASLNPGAPPVVVDGTIMEKRQENATPAITATSVFAGGKWTVTFSRKLIAGGVYKDFVPGRLYTIGLAIHAGHTNHRFHYVSLERTMALDQGAADFIAVRSAP